MNGSSVEPTGNTSRHRPASSGLVAALLAAGAAVGHGQVPATANSTAEPPGVLRRMWLSGQVNFVAQGHPKFRSLYEGSNSFRSKSKLATSRVATFFAGLRVGENSSLIFDLEWTSGANLSRGSGIAGFPNLDIVAMPNSNPYVARALFHHSFRFSEKTVEVNRGPLQLAAKVAAKRLDFYVGKYSITDFFDVNAIGGDSHLQFLNWSVGNNAAYGYAADARGYTYGVVVEYHDGGVTARFSESLQARADDLNRLDFRVGQSHAENFELEVPLRMLSGRVGLVRALTFVNHGPLAHYRDANAEYAERGLAEPDVTNHRRLRRKYGFGLNAEQELSSTFRAYGRLGWADGKTESLANTQANASASGGVDSAGDRWHRPDDKFGAAFAISAISGDHRTYLQLGGTGALLGDGNLNYGREKVVEVYYTTKLRPGVYLSADVQRIWNPGYNRHRGPIVVGALRLHMEAAVLKEPR